jgi:hypothetical protein
LVLVAMSPHQVRSAMMIKRPFRQGLQTLSTSNHNTTKRNLKRKTILKRTMKKTTLAQTTLWVLPRRIFLMRYPQSTLFESLNPFRRAGRNTGATTTTTFSIHTCGNTFVLIVMAAQRRCPIEHRPNDLPTTLTITITIRNNSQQRVHERRLCRLVV